MTASQTRPATIVMPVSANDDVLSAFTLNWTVSPGGKIVDAAADPFLQKALLTRRPVSVWMFRVLARSFGNQNRRKFLSVLRKLKNGEMRSGADLDWIGANGTPKSVRVTAWALRQPDDSVFCAMTATEISDLRAERESLQQFRDTADTQLVELHRTKARLENQTQTLMETAQKLTETREKLDAANRGKSNFLTYMSHELRTPLNAIIGFSEVINSESFGPLGNARYKEYASDIHEAGGHLLGLINDVLDFSKIEAGREELFEQQVSLEDIIDSCIRMLNDRIRNNALTLEIDMERPLPALYADERKVKQILLNLLTNAVKYTPENGEIHLSVARPEFGGITLKVRDNGIGISPEDIPKALGIFGQIKDSYSTQQEGTGLGLPLSRSLTELHGGTLEIESDKGAGTTVQIWFPENRVITPPTSLQTRNDAAFS